jgi:ATP-binding cassette subfamily A (ABC1) protein 3
MEEASALANKVAILAKRLLAVGTTAELEARYATYEVHFSARSREDALRARELMARVPGARAADDVATRFEVPVVPAGGDGLTLEALFDTLAETDLEFAVERPALESVFLKVIREHKVEEEDEQRRARSVWATLKRLV